MRDMLEDIWYEHKKTLGILLAVVVLCVVAFFVLNEDEDATLTESMQVNKELATALQDKYSILRMTNVGGTDKSAYQMTLYLKKPFIRMDELQDDMENLIELLKWQINDEKDGKWLQGVEVTIYDRVLAYEEGLNPRGTVTYMLAEPLKKERDEYLEDYDFRWEDTLSQEKFPDYEEDYGLNITFKQYETGTGITPLSDQEYEFLVKMMKYSAVSGTTLQRAFYMYLEWDLGIPYTEALGYYSVTEEFDKFLERYTGIGGELDILDDAQTVLLKQELAIENPRLLVFLLTKKHLDDKLEAKIELLNVDRDFYLDVFIEDAKKQVEESGGDLSSVEALESIGEDTEGIWGTNEGDIWDSVEDEDSATEEKAEDSKSSVSE